MNQNNIQSTESLKQRKVYETPQIVVHGDVASLTLQTNRNPGNTDFVPGPNKT